MRKLRDDTIIRNLLWGSTHYPHLQPSFTDELFETALQDRICLYEHGIEKLEAEIEYMRRCVTLLVDCHFEFVKDRRGFVKKVHERIRPKMLKSRTQSNSWYVDSQVKILEDYLKSQSKISAKAEPIEDKSTYLRKVRENCSERRPWLPRPAFEPELIDAATGDYAIESF